MSKIKGVPDGYELVRIGQPLRGESCILTTGDVFDCVNDLSGDGYAIVRKIEPAIRPMTRDEFLAAWKLRGFCPLIDLEGDIDIVQSVVVVEGEDQQVTLYFSGSLDYECLAAYRFALDNSPLTVQVSQVEIVPTKPIEPYRPFANAAEFAPHKERWLTRFDGKKQVAGEWRCTAYTNAHVFIDGCSENYQSCFERYKFADANEPFGVKA